MNKIKSFFSGLGATGKKTVTMAMGVVAMMSLTMFSFAADPADAAITATMLEPVLQGVKDNIAVILPVGIGLFAIVLGINFIPKIFKKFLKG